MPPARTATDSVRKKITYPRTSIGAKFKLLFSRRRHMLQSIVCWVELPKVLDRSTNFFDDEAVKDVKKRPRIVYAELPLSLSRGKIPVECLRVNQTPRRPFHFLSPA